MMSRDLTPVQYYLLSEHNKDKGLSAFDVMEGTSWVINGVSHPLHSKEEMNLRRQYPLFGYLLNTFLDVHDSLSKIPGGLAFLKKKEDELSSYIQSSVGDHNSPMIKWFEGELDPNFYYSERNEELFVEFLIENAKAVSRQPLDSLITSASAKLAEATPDKNTIQNDVER